MTYLLLYGLGAICLLIAFVLWVIRHREVGDQARGDGDTYITTSRDQKGGITAGRVENRGES